MSGPLLNKAAALAAFRRMDELLGMRRLRCRVYVFGGAAMLLAAPTMQPWRCSTRPT